MSNSPPEAWKNVAFGDVVKNVMINEKNPLDNGLERYVGLEHLDPNNLKIIQWGLIKEGTSFTKKFVRGQILFGKRRVYQHKVALAEFDGLCSGDILVFDVKNSKLIPELLPFIVQSDNFFDYAIKTSAGSLSPRTKWKDLSKYEISLPPIEKQRRIAEILWQVEESIRKQEYLQIKIQKIKHRLFKKFSLEGIKNSDLKDSPIGKIPKHWSVLTLDECIRKRDNFSHPPHNKEKYIGLEHFESGAHSLKGFIDSINVKSNCSAFNKGELLYSKLRPNLDKAVLANFDGLCSTEVLVLNSNELTTNEYLLYHFHSIKFIKYNEHHSYGTKMPRTSFDIIGKYQIALPPLEEQKAILKIIKQFDILGEKINLNSDNLTTLNKYLLDDLLFGVKCLRSG